MVNQWLRLWHDMPNDPKWRTIARAAKQPIPVVLSVYMHVLVCASVSEPRGGVAAMVAEDVASALDVDTSDVEAVLEAMQGRVLDGDRVSGWSKRQVMREDDSAGRVRELRARRTVEPSEQSSSENAVVAREEDGAEDDVTPCNAVKRKVTLDTETETEEKEQKKKPAPTAVAAAAGVAAICTLGLTGGKVHVIVEADVRLWAGAYPAVDVLRELPKIAAWLDANPAKRSATVGGSKQRIVRWLTRAQDQGGNRGASGGGDNRGQRRVDAQLAALRRANESDADSRVAGGVRADAANGDGGHRAADVLAGPRTIFG